jgi:hypothetical protein
MFVEGQEIVYVKDNILRKGTVFRVQPFELLVESSEYMGLVVVDKDNVVKTITVDALAVLSSR